MKKFIKNVLCFIIPIIIVLIGLEILLRSVDNDYKYKRSYLDRNAHKIKVLSLGSSHAYFGIDPNCFAHTTFNLAHVSQDLKWDCKLFYKYINNLDALQYLILPISYFSPYGSLEKGDESWRIKNYAIYYGLTPPKLDYSFECIGHLNVNKIMKAFRKESNKVCNDTGQGESYRLELRDINWAKTGESAAKRHRAKYGIEQYNENIKIASEIILSCKDRGIKVILLTTPTYYTYRKYIDAEQLQKMLNFCDSLVDSFDNVVYLNYFDDERFVEDDYFDADHLSDIGAKKLSSLINEYIIENDNKGL